MKIIFLDFDGVLNSFHTTFPNEDEYSGLNPENIILLNKIIKATNAKIVISSSWRLGRSLDYLTAILKKAGLVGDIIDKTPPYLNSRGIEIQKWLQMGHSESIESFVILDDCQDMDHLISFLIRIENSDGLKEFHVEKAIKILNKEVYEDNFS